jgi:hypothetical protein
MRTNLLVLPASLLALTISLTTRAERTHAQVEQAPPSAPRPAEVDRDAGALVTLRCLDDLTATYAFTEADYGYVIHERAVHNRVSHISFHRWVQNSLVVGIQGRSRGVIRDLGDVRTKRTAMSVLPSLVREGDVIRDANPEGSDLPEQGIALNDESRSAASATVVPGHVYLVRMDDADATHFVGLRVVDYQPGLSVTFRWRPL